MVLTWTAEVSDVYGDTQDFTVLSILLFWASYMMLACWTYGLSVPSGLFVPSLLAGASFGSLSYQVGERIFECSRCSECSQCSQCGQCSQCSECSQCSL
jgi:H+/Cl- antiporter ClcA